MHPVAYIEFVSVLACLAAIAFVIRGWKRTGFLRAVPILLLTLLLLMMFYGLALFLEWSGLGERLRWHFIEDFASVFIPFIWAFVLYAIINFIKPLPQGFDGLNRQIRILLDDFLHHHHRTQTNRPLRMDQ